MLKNWITYKKNEISSNIMPDMISIPDINLIDNDFFNLVIDYYKTKAVTLNKPVMRDNFLEDVFLALHFCGSFSAEYLNDCLCSLEVVVQNAEKEEYALDVDYFFVQSQTVSQSIWLKAASSQEYLLVYRGRCHIGTLSDDKSFSEEPDDCPNSYKKEWIPIAITLFIFKNEGGTLHVEALQKLPRQL